MSDLITGDDRDSAETESDRSAALSTRARGPIAVAIIILLLLLLTCSLIGSLTQFQSSRVRFIAKNAECLSCHTEMLPKLRLTTQHQPFVERHCTSCHTPHGKKIEAVRTGGPTAFLRAVGRWLEWGPFRFLLRWFGSYSAGAGIAEQRESTETVPFALGKSELRTSATTLCWECHPDNAPELQMSTTHVPFAGGHCTSCHDPHASDMDSLVLGNEERVCAQCHPLGDLAQPFLHPPVENWQCLSCHRPHSSEVDGMLVARQGVLCLSCHPRVATDQLRAVQHQPFDQDRCTGCHEPHGAPAEPLLIDAEPNVCYRCHTSIAVDFQRVSHHPVGTSIQCSSCHWHHSGPYGNLTRAEGNSLCYMCHGGVGVTYVKSSHGHMECTKCHGAHGSNNAPILNRRNPSVCLGCHTGSGFTRFSGRNTHPVSPEFWDKYGQKPLTCTSSCHGPHGTGFDRMLRDYEFPLDGVCLRCHSTVGVDF